MTPGRLKLTSDWQLVDPPGYHHARFRVGKTEELALAVPTHMIVAGFLSVDVEERGDYFATVVIPTYAGPWSVQVLVEDLAAT
jgi:hypothetical protein